MMKPVPPQEALLALAETADSDIRRQVWPRLKALHADDPLAHRQALALLRDHHRRLVLVVCPDQHGNATDLLNTGLWWVLRDKWWAETVGGG